MREYWLSFVSAYQFNNDQIQYLAMYCPDENLEILCEHIETLNALQFTTDEMMLLAMGKNGHTIPSVLQNYNTLLSALQSKTNQFVPWKYINELMIKLIIKFQQPETDYIFQNISQFAEYNCNFSDFIHVLFMKEGLLNFQVLLINLHKIQQAYALGFTTQDLLKIAEYSAKNLQTLFDTLEMVNRNEMLTTEYFTACLSTHGLSDLLLISIEEAVQSNQQSVSAPEFGSEISHDDGVIISENTVNKKRKPSESQASETDVIFSGPTTKRVATALSASNTQTVLSTMTSEVMTSTSSNPRDLNLPNFGEGIMLLTMSDLENLALDDEYNLYVIKDGRIIPVFPNHTFLAKGAYESFREMQFYVLNDQCVAVVSKDPSMGFDPRADFNGIVFSGNMLSTNKYRELDESRKQVFTERYCVAHTMCERIFAKFGIDFKQKHITKKRSIATKVTRLDRALNDEYISAFNSSELGASSTQANFGPDAMLLTKHDLKTLEVDDDDNFYITKNGEKIPVFPEHEFLDKGSFDTFKEMYFYVLDNNCVGVISKKPQTQLSFLSSKSHAAIKGVTIYHRKNKMNKTERTQDKSVLNAQYDEAHTMCQTILSKLNLPFTRKTNKQLPVETTRNGELTTLIRANDQPDQNNRVYLGETPWESSIGNVSETGFFSHQSGSGPTRGIVDTNQRKQP